jgi:putative FmdB family regulatory protein
MPIYEYRCERGHNFEEIQRMADDPLTSCTICDAPVQRVFHPVAVHFKGSGFYTTDYGKRKAALGSSEAKGDSSKDSKGADSKKESKPASDSSSKSSSSSSSD